MSRHTTQYVMLNISVSFLFFFFFNDTATTEIYTLSLHDALPIWVDPTGFGVIFARSIPSFARGNLRDWKSTRLNSSHMSISYAVFCLKKTTTSCLTKTRGGSPSKSNQGSLSESRSDQGCLPHWRSPAVSPLRVRFWRFFFFKKVRPVTRLSLLPPPPILPI